MLYLGENFGIGLLSEVTYKLSSLFLKDFLPQFVQPAHLFFLSQIRLAVLGLPLEKTNMYSKTCEYLLPVLLAGKVAPFFSYNIVSCNFKPHSSMKYNACLNDVPVSLPSYVASPTTQTITPPFANFLVNNFAISSKGNEYILCLSFLMLPL